MLERRLQILIDEPRYRRVAARARERGTSVAAVIREAIDIAFPSDLAKKRAAVKRILAAPLMEVPETYEELKAEIEAIRYRDLDRP
jgi:hypothetical protein